MYKLYLTAEFTQSKFTVVVIITFASLTLSFAFLCEIVQWHINISVKYTFLTKFENVQRGSLSNGNVQLGVGYMRAELECFLFRHVKHFVPAKNSISDNTNT